VTRPQNIPWKPVARFVTTAVSPDGLPSPARGEVAFAGRSNVGKSSLLNALVGHAGLARVSNTPGRTQALNVFGLEEKASGLSLYLVDMPGYGFARAPKDAVKAWGGLVEDYLRGRPSLRRLFLLIDARRGLTPADKRILGLLKEAAVSTQVVLTKADKLKEGEAEKLAEAMARDLKHYVVTHPDILATSAVTNAGIEALRASLRELSET
jgi:GTP-binding protein